MESLESIRSLVIESRPRTANAGYAPTVRDRVVAYVRARSAVGVGASAIAEELGLSRHSVIAWAKLTGHERLQGAGRGTAGGLAASQSQPQFLQVHVVADPVAAAMPLGPVLVPGPTPVLRSHVLVSPRGYRVEGLDVDDLGRLLASLG